MTALLPKLLLLLPYLGVAVLTLVISDFLLRIRERSTSSAEFLAGNNAIGLRRGGFLLGTLIGFSGILVGESSGNLTADLIVTAEYAGLLIVMMQIALLVNDALVLPNVANSSAVKGGNSAVAATEVGSMVATGLIAHAAIGGANGGMLPVIAFFALGQLALVFMAWSFSLVHGKAALVKEVEAGNLSAGVIMGAKFWAFGLIIAMAAGGQFTGWAEDLTAFGITAAAGLLFLYIAGWLVDFLIVRWQTLEQMVSTKNVASALAYGGGQVGMAYAVSVLVF
ncbi:MAG: hypothetical protein ABA06_02385 [Parcubacteria bacterium C7867-001]|nr:MAG: hypothetical protein ABA06_02385 [Parcubacteria bacterium C7867-001]